ncbi:hypothetical protein DM860_006081 [Cuscuta australis]|uniref:Uncharacterized protein n=1 Tax=Cuscuta australis TaxID=267555 RepID=A0A328DJW0_9ASTE|nr:hypothetical protein DM860_006081 [Cuscuta australis]
MHQFKTHIITKHLRFLQEYILLKLISINSVSLFFWDNVFSLIMTTNISVSHFFYNFPSLFLHLLNLQVHEYALSILHSVLVLLRASLDGAEDNLKCNKLSTPWRTCKLLPMSLALHSLR